MKHWPMINSAATCCNVPYARWQADGVELARDVTSVDCPGCAVGLRYDAIINDHMDHFARCCALLKIDGYESRKSSIAVCGAIEAAVEALVKGALQKDTFGTRLMFGGNAAEHGESEEGAGMTVLLDGDDAVRLGQETLRAIVGAKTPKDGY